MKRYYRIKNYGPNRMSPKWSIDDCDEDGHYIAQAAFFFKTRADAEKRSAEIIIEDNALGDDSIILTNQPPTRYTRIADFCRLPPAS